jgi:propionyl-CoA synthetase
LSTASASAPRTATSRYHEVYQHALRDPAGFWGEAADGIDWYEKATKVFDPSAGIYGRWYVGATCNTCFNAVDRHVLRGRGAQNAIIYDSPVGEAKRSISYAELLAEVKTLGGVLADLGVGRGDRVVLYMPMVPEAVIAMLACARIGAIHSVVFGGFAANELATRLNDAKPKAILSASCGIEPGRIVKYKPLLDEAVALASSKPQACLILQRPQAEADLVAGRDHDWASLREAAIKAGRTAECVAVAATDPLYILYTSGTTGKPKGVVRDHVAAVAVQRITIKRVPPRRQPVERCGMAWQPTSLPAVRFTATFLAHAMARAQYNPTITSVWSPPAQPVIRT